ncbi:MAG: chromate transporter [Lentisphaerae bacterium]|nr:chromate transporter [Lentisphaerota bacterium]
MKLLSLYLLFIKYGLLSFGGGYVLITLFIHDLVDKYRFLSNDEFANLLAVSQMTPGPIGVNTATYVGFKVGEAHGGVWEGILCGITTTAGLLTPAIFLVLLAAYYFKKWEHNRLVQGVLYGMRPATLGLICSAVLIFANISIFTTPVTTANVRAWLTTEVAAGSFGIRFIPLAIAAASAWVMWKYKANVIYIIAAAALLGALFIR